MLGPLDSLRLGQSKYESKTVNDRMFFYVRVAEALHRPANRALLEDAELIKAVSRANRISTRALDDNLWGATAEADQLTDFYRTGRSAVEAIWNVVLALHEARRLILPPSK